MKAAAFPSGRPPYLRFLPRFLFATRGGAAPYVLKAWLLALVPSLAIGVAIAALTSGGPAREFPVSEPLMILLLVAVSPLFETLIMIPLLLGLVRIVRPGGAVIASALLWAAAHSLYLPLWGLVVWWPFLILSTAMLTWRERGLGMAVGVVTAIHVLQNAAATGLNFAV